MLTDRQLLLELRKELSLFKEETRKTIASLEKENTLLKERLAKYENPKNSNNSGVSPSQDPFRKTKSMRVKSNKPQGGQKGHKGSKLKKVRGVKLASNLNFLITYMLSIYHSIN